MKSVKSRQRTW